MLDHEFDLQGAHWLQHGQAFRNRPSELSAWLHGQDITIYSSHSATGRDGVKEPLVLCIGHNQKAEVHTCLTPDDARQLAHQLLVAADATVFVPPGEPHQPHPVKHVEPVKAALLQPPASVPVQRPAPPLRRGGGSPAL